MTGPRRFAAHCGSCSALLAAAVLFAAVALGATSLSCALKNADETGGADRPNSPLKTAQLAVGPASVIAELARTPLERERGLMFRTSLADGHGMLFVFESDQHLAFWMKNTVIPLTLAYIASDGTIHQIVDLAPGSLEAVQSERSVRYALEVPRGWFDRVGVKVGDRAVLPPLD